MITVDMNSYVATSIVFQELNYFNSLISFKGSLFLWIITFSPRYSLKVYLHPHFQTLSHKFLIHLILELQVFIKYTLSNCNNTQKNFIIINDYNVIIEASENNDWSSDFRVVSIDMGFLIKYFE